MVGQIFIKLFTKKKIKPKNSSKRSLNIFANNIAYFHSFNVLKHESKKFSKKSLLITNMNQALVI